MYLRDIAIVVCAIFALFLSVQREGSFSYRKAWYHTLSEDQKLGDIDAVAKLPAPLVADLNGDGSLEVIVATHDYKLQLIEPEAAGSFGEGFAEAQVVAEVSLLPPKVTVGADRWPVAMSVGYVDAEPKEKVRPPRKQVLVVVTAGWHVLAYDHNLRLMWETAIGESFPEHAHMREVAVYVSPHRVKGADRGLVVVGGSVEMGDLEAAEAGLQAGDSTLEGVLEEEIRSEQSEARHAHSQHAYKDLGNDKSSLKDAVDTSRHFSYFAFEGGKGDARWKHDSSAFHKDLAEASDELQDQHNYRMDAEKLAARHFGEMSCRDFRESVLHVLPHRWLSPADTHFEEAVFVKHREGAGAQKRQLARNAAARESAKGRATHSAHVRVRKSKAGGHGSSLFSWGHLLGSRPAHNAAHKSQQGGMTHRHTHLSHNVSTNALVAHLEEGIEAIHLYTGRTLCKLHLPSSFLHADLNGDGVVDHVQVALGAASSSSSSSGRDSRDAPLHHVSVKGHGTMSDCLALMTSGIPPKEHGWAVSFCEGHHGLAEELMGDAHGQNEHVQVLPPVMLPIPRADGTYSHLRGQRGLVAFYTNQGHVAAYSSSGALLWNAVTPAHWTSANTDVATSSPSIQPLPLHTHAIPTALLAVGATHGIILSEHGNTLAEFRVSYPPVSTPVLADFNGDGLVDVMVVTARGVFGYEQVQHYGGLQFGALLLTLIIAMGVVWYTQQYEAGGRRQRKLRSTEFTD